MTKLPFQQVTAPTDARDVANQSYVELLEGNIARGSYIQAYLSSDQIGIGAADVVLTFDSVARARGTLSVSSGVFSGLKAGRTYLLIGDVQHNSASNTRIPWAWYDRTNSQKLGSAGVTVAPGFTSTSGYAHSPIAVVTPGTDIEVDLRSGAAPTVGTVDVQSNNGWGEFNSHASIVEIGSTQVIGSEWIPLETKEVTGSAIENFEFDYQIDGNRDEAYKVEFFIKTAVATTRDIRIRVNDLISSTNVAAGSRQTGGAHETYTDLVLSRSLRNYAHGWFIFNAAEKPLGGAVAHPRTVLGKMVIADDPASGAGTFEQDFACIWTDAGNLVRMVLQNTATGSDTGVSELDVGTICRLYRKAKPSDHLNPVVTRSELVAAGQTLSLSGLDGDLHGEYEVVGKLIYSTAAQTIDMAPNGSGTSLLTKWSFNGGAAVTDAAGQIVNIGATSSAAFTMFRFRFLAKRDGPYRMFNGQVTTSYNGTNIDIQDTAGVYFDNTANLTSLDFISSQAAGLLAGSWAEIRRLS